MEAPALLKLKQKDISALLVFGMLGLLVACVIPDPTWAIYGSLLVTYHCFLGWLVFMREGRFKRPLPAAAIVPIHLVFVVIVVALVAARNQIPRFGLLPFPLAAIGFTLLCAAAGREQPSEGRAAARSHRLTTRSRHREASRSSSRARYSSTAPSQAAQMAQAALSPVASSLSAAWSAVQAAVAASAPQAEPGVIVPAPAEASPQARHDPSENFARAAVIAPESAPAKNPVPAQPEILAAQPAAAAEPPEPDLAARNFKPLVADAALMTQVRKKSPKSEPEFYRDTSIAESLRKTPSDPMSLQNPVLSATAEDHEEWLKERGTQNPTHRVVGMTVREEYEQWLMGRALARAAQDVPNGQAAAKQA